MPRPPAAAVDRGSSGSSSSSPSSGGGGIHLLGRRLVGVEFDGRGLVRRWLHAFRSLGSIQFVRPFVRRALRSGRTAATERRRRAEHRAAAAGGVRVPTAESGTVRARFLAARMPAVHRAARRARPTPRTAIPIRRNGPFRPTAGLVTGVRSPERRSIGRRATTAAAAATSIYYPTYPYYRNYYPLLLPGLRVRARLLRLRVVRPVLLRRLLPRRVRWRRTPAAVSGRRYGSGTSSYGGGPTGSLRLKIKPRDAKVYVDGYFVGVIDDFDGMFQKLGIDAGGHRVEIKAPVTSRSRSTS